jgi:hypothetical protein
MENMIKLIAKRINQLEENYHFNLKEYSFIYKGKKAFINNLIEKITMISPFIYFRKELDQHINTFELEKIVSNPKDFHNYIQKCMSIIGNMLDSEQMGSVESYLNHIWDSFDKALNDEKSINSMQDFVNDLSAIITMIDFSVEMQLSTVSQLQREGLVAQSLLQNQNPDLEIGRFFSIGNDGTIERFNIEDVNRVITGRTTSNKPNYSEKPREQIDLSKVKPLNTKEI